MLYAPIFVSLLAFFAALKAHQLGFFSWIIAAIFVVLVPFLVNDVAIASLAYGWDIALANITSAKSILIVIVQIMSSFVIFRLIEQYDESTTFWIVTALIGCAHLYWLVPLVFSLLLS